MFRRLVGVAIKAYHMSPFHCPACAGPLARGLDWVQRAFGRTSVTHDVGPFRMHLDLGQHIDSQIYYTGEWEAETVQTIRRIVKPGDITVDVGANIGYLTLMLASQVGAGGKVYSFEASDWAFERLKANIRLNGMEWIYPFRLAIGDESRSDVTMKLPCGYTLDGRDSATAQCVDVVTLDGFLERTAPDGRIDFIKSDTDGMEPHVLRGAAATLRKFRPTMIFELNPGALVAHGERLADLAGMLEALDYRLYRAGTLEPIGNVEVLSREVAAGWSVNVVAACNGKLGQ